MFLGVTFTHTHAHKNTPETEHRLCYELVWAAILFWVFFFVWFFFVTYIVYEAERHDAFKKASLKLWLQYTHTHALKRQRYSRPCFIGHCRYGKRSIIPQKPGDRTWSTYMELVIILLLLLSGLPNRWSVPKRRRLYSMELILCLFVFKPGIERTIWVPPPHWPTQTHLRQGIGNQFMLLQRERQCKYATRAVL